jgi:hypothetical protein
MSAQVKDSHKDVPIQDIVPSESTSARVLSSDDALVADLIKEQPTEAQLAQLKIIGAKRPDLLAFPEEVLAQNGKKYRFGWLSKGKNLQVSLRTYGWVLCNRGNSSFIKPHRFGTHGGVEQAGMLLAFMPEEQYVELFEAAPGRQSANRVRHLTKGIFENQDKDAPISFYKPEEKDED